MPCTAGPSSPYDVPLEMGCGNIKYLGGTYRKALPNHDIGVLPRDRVYPVPGLRGEKLFGSKSRVWKLRVHFLRCPEIVQG